MADNQVTPFQLTDQFTMENFNQRINETNTALQNNDPRNWALGITAYSPKNEINRLSVVDETVSNGWYLVYLSDGGNIGGATQGTLSVDASTRGITQEFRFYYAGYGGFCKLTRIKPYQGEWQPWEWVNPPMHIGGEFRTTERWNGKPVYAIVVDFGPLPNSSVNFANIPGWVSTNRAFSVNVIAHSINETDPVPLGMSSDYSSSFWFIQSPNIYIKSRVDLSEYTSCYVYIKYTKE